MAERVVVLIDRSPNLRLVSLDDVLAHRAAQIAAIYRLRGSDAVYVTVAELFQATLITWDAEMLQRTPATVPTLTPTEWVDQVRMGG